MVVRTAVEYMNDQLADRVKVLQKALNQAERMIAILEQENNNLKDALNSLASENNKDYILDSEAFNEPMLTI
jgi:cell division protein FtsB